MKKTAMKKLNWYSIVARVGLPALAAAPWAAQAQSSVKIYGAIDQGIDHVSNSGGSSLTRLRDGTYDGMFGSRWGLEGEDALGGGLKTVFKLEAGFSAENGQSRQGGRMFGRQAYVGLSDAQWGTLTLGRQYDSVVDYLQPVTAIGQFGGPFMRGGDIDNVANTFRVDNAIKYASAPIGGLKFGAMASFAEGAQTGSASPSGRGMWGAGARYAEGGLQLAAAYFHAKSPALLFTDGNMGPNTTGAAIGAAGPFSYVGQPRTQKVFGLGGSYAFGRAGVGANFSSSRFDGANGTNSTVRFNNYELWAKYSPTPSTLLGASYVFTDGKVGYSGETPKYHQLGLMASYSLSKRTTLYSALAYQRAAGSATRADIFEFAVGSASTTNKQSLLRLGLVHLF